MKQSETETFQAHITYLGKIREVQIMGLLYGQKIDGRFPTTFSVTVHNVDSFHLMHTPGGWKPYERERMRDLQELVDLVGEAIVAYYQ